jgi:hypothetical protein
MTRMLHHVLLFASLFVCLISHQPAVLFSQNKSATSNQPTIFFSQNKPASATSQTDRLFESHRVYVERPTPSARRVARPRQTVITIDGQMGHTTRHCTNTTQLDTIHYSCRVVPARRVDSSAHTRHATSLVVSCRDDGTANTLGRVQHGTITFVTQNFSNQTTNRELLTLN